jgi:hypothetical protein
MHPYRALSQQTVEDNKKEAVAAITMTANQIEHPHPNATD